MTNALGTKTAVSSPAPPAGDGLKNLLSLLTGPKAGAPAPSSDPAGQLCAELAFKLAQVVFGSKDQGRLESSVMGLVGALQGLRSAVSGDPPNTGAK